MGEGKGEVLPQGMYTHTHITRSDYLEGLVARQKLGGGIVTCCFTETREQRSKELIGGTTGGSPTNEKMTHVDRY